MIDHFRLLAPLYQHLVPPPEAERLARLLRLPMPRPTPTGGALLDVGGGTGRVAAVLRDRIGGPVVVYDETEAMLRQVDRDRGLQPLAGAAERLPFPDGSFDRVLVVDAFHHFADHGAVVAELVRILRPGGRLLIEEPDLNHLLVKGVAVAEKIALMRSHFYYPHQIGALIAAHGLQPHIETDGRFTAWIMADKPR
ncbi:MAG: class I SAM-dependent methyltransferase [Candidatus Promineifilaceae bacterium]|nr:class I SAM-dependent methyltransferase [Candidatus Promineifilaceae bacterium]